MSTTAVRSFDGLTLDDLQSMNPEDFDQLPFGVIGLNPDFVVIRYNATESRMAGLPASTVIGEQYFLTVAQCMNNYLIAQRFEDEPELDATLNYVLTLRMRPTPVRLRLLKQPSCTTSYILVQR